MAQMRAQKERELAKERALRDARRAAAAAAEQDMDMEGGGGGALAALHADAAVRGAAHARGAVAVPGAGAAGFVDYSRRAFYRDFVKVGRLDSFRK